MKKQQLLLFVIFLTSTLTLSAQSPQGFNYQTVVRNAAGEILANQSVGTQFILHQTTPTGTAVYTETWSTSTNDYGLLSFAIGNGTSTDDFSLIDWSAGPYYLETLLDVSGGTTYVSMGTSQLMSVPYAMFAENSSNSYWDKNGDDVFYNSSTGSVAIGSNNATSKLWVVQTDPTNNNVHALNGGLGIGLLINQINTGVTNPGIVVNQFGTDNISRGIEINMDMASQSTGLVTSHNGLGRGQEISLSNTANNNVGSVIFHSGLGIGQYIGLDNTDNYSFASFIENSGIQGGGQIINLDNTAQESVGQMIRYSGTGTTLTGGGNALELLHYGTNGDAAQMWVGDPNQAPGPTNTTSEYNTLLLEHLATGTSTTPGLSKSALTAINHSADATVRVFNNGSSDGDGMVVQTFPTTDPLVSGIYSTASTTGGNSGLGVGVWGDGENYGIVGSTSLSGSGFGVFSIGNSGATGAKLFHIDHPLDPENKTLSHYSVESDEIMNMYSGTIELDSNGNATVDLPEYFSAVNKNPRYQLTAIGTPTVPYIEKEIYNNIFSIKGAPNTKVSWVVYAERNDPTIKYFREKLNLEQNVRNKNTDERGKYLTPQAYGKSPESGIFYKKKIDAPKAGKSIPLENITVEKSKTIEKKN
ncbi:hypothetical protein [Aurantibacter sp.]|uniref:hypothetical protein n=1 Tax=Aurantibacter sp. TaxID=2807103 RepID=UPI0035C84B50